MRIEIIIQESLLNSIAEASANSGVFLNVTMKKAGKTSYRVTHVSTSPTKSQPGGVTETHIRLSLYLPPGRKTPRSIAMLLSTATLILMEKYRREIEPPRVKVMRNNEQVLVI